jgi:hypothetical protein
MTSFCHLLLAPEDTLEGYSIILDEYQKGCSGREAREIERPQRTSILGFLTGSVTIKKATIAALAAVR